MLGRIPSLSIINTNIKHKRSHCAYDRYCTHCSPFFSLLSTPTNKMFKLQLTDQYDRYDGVQ